MANAQAANSSTQRGLKADLPTFYATDVDRWAIVVGISQYKDSSINLKYADRDAEALYELLKTPTGGGFEEAHICKLVNEEATTANITRALRSFLKKPGKQDIVLLYFACHGAPDRDRPDILYLLTHDTDPKDIAGTALPMREINLSLKENLLAERVIIVADTCHSAGISKAGTRDAGENSGVINRYLQEVGESQKGIALLTSAEANQVSFEDEKWGGGHGVFTHYLLEGMRGAADRNPKNGIVTVGELFEYVRENVKRATDDKQHPCIGPDSFDRNLPVAITAGISAQEHYELGCQLYQIALKLDDKYCFESANRHLREAMRQAAIVGQKLPEAHLQLGLSLTATGSLPEEAVQAFENAIKAGIPDANYYLGIAYLNQENVDVAKKHLEAFLTKQPESDKADVVNELISWLDASNSFNPSAVKRYALLIGINYSELDKERLGPHVKSLNGCVNDIEILDEVLSQRYNFQVKTLPDIKATYANIIGAFEELQQITSPRDIVVIFYAGHDSDGSWLAADTSLDEEGNRLNTIISDKLYHLIDSVPAFSKYLIMDIAVSEALEEFITKVNKNRLCTLFFSASLGQLPCELSIEETQKYHGYFTYKLVQELWQASEDTLEQDLFEKVRKEVQAKCNDQTPFFLGNLNKPLFSPRLRHCPEPFLFSQRRYYSAFNEHSLEALYQKGRRQFTSIFSDFYYSLGLAFLEKGNNARALTLLKTATDNLKLSTEKKFFELGVSQVNSQLYSAALQTFQKCLELSTLRTDSVLLATITATIIKLAASERYALLIGIDRCSNDSYMTSREDAVSNTLTLKEVLVHRYGFQPENVKVFHNEYATYQNILSAFRELAELSQLNSVFFYFSGRGSVDSSDNPTILAFDSRCKGIPDICLTDLTHLVTQNETSLVSIIDSWWTVGGENFVEYHETNTSSSTRAVSLELDANATQRDESKIPKIGCLSLYPISIKYRDCNNLLPNFIPNFTSLLFEFLRAEEPAVKTYEDFQQFYKKENRFYKKKNNGYDIDCGCHIQTSGNEHILGLPFFSNSILEIRIRDLFIESEEEPTQFVVSLLKRLIEQRNGAAPEELFNLGIAYYRLNKFDKSIIALETAIDQVVGQSSNAPEQFYPEAHYWLGRVLYESKRDPARAVSELRLATQQSPDNSAAHYYLGKALCALVEQEILTEAERAFKAYLNAGAPLGQQEEVQEFLKSRKQ